MPRVALAVCLAASLVVAQETPPRTDVEPIVVTATRLAQDPLEVPYSIDVIDADALRARSYRTTPQALRDLPGVMVQETSAGQGSPYIRGFTGYRDLFLIDGIRLNNSVFRDGPNQYWATVDPLSLHRLEVVKGPSSVLYGSDAIGGTVNAITRSPSTWSDAPGFAIGGRTLGRYASAEDSVILRAEVDIGWTREDGSRTGLLAGGSAKSFDDVEGGRGVGTQLDSGYEETDADLKIEHWFDERVRAVFLHQRARQDGVPRTHRTVGSIDWRGLARGTDLRHDFDQVRDLTYLQLHAEKLGGAIDAVHASVSWHHQREVRDRIRGNGAQDFQGFDVGTLGLSLQLDSDSPIGELTYGIEWYRDDVDSFLRNVVNPSPADPIQGPVADDAVYDLFGVYVQDRIPLADALDLTLGGRFNHARADSDDVRDPVTDTRFSIDEDWSDLVGSARLLYRLVPDCVHVFGGVSQGFRAPNLSDLSRFDTARSGEFEIPAPGLRAEDYVSWEVGVKVQTEGTRAQAAWFRTDIDSQIQRFPTGNVNGNGEREITKANVGDGWLQGVELAAGQRVLPQTTVLCNFTFLDGRVTNFEGPTSALTDDHPTRLMPLTVQVGARYDDERGRFWAESTLTIAADADKLSFNDQRDTSRIPPGGTPGYQVWDLRGGWRLAERTTVDVLLENVTDVDYRVHGSGSNMPGRSLIVGFETRF
jgi:hemoglobin/transferrin/lactoferrin receptor protein